MNMDEKRCSDGKTTIRLLLRSQFQERGGSKPVDNFGFKPLKGGERDFARLILLTMCDAP